MDIRYSIEKISINRFDEEVYITIDGYAVNTDSSFPDTTILINHEKTDYSLSRRERPDIVSKFKLKPSALMCGFHIVIRQTAAEPEQVEVCFGSDDCKGTWSADRNKIKDNTVCSPILYYIEHNVYSAKDSTVSLTGWAVSLDQRQISLSVTDEDGNELDNEHRFFYRRDMSDLYFSGDEKGRYGFNISFRGNKKKKYDLHFKTGRAEEIFRVFSQGVEEENQNMLSRIKGFINLQNFEKVENYLKTYGVKQTLKSVSRKIRGKNFYHDWFKRHQIREAQLKEQRAHVFSYAPKISLLVPVFNPPEEYFREMVESVQKQSYANWELCLADGSDDSHPVKKLIREYAASDGRIRYTFLDKNYGISGNTNKALDLAAGEYIGLFDHDDLLEPDILFEIVSSLQETKHDVIYTDEDKFNSKTKQFEIPNFKPDFDSTLLRSENYITHFFTVRAEILKGVGGFHSEYDGSQDLDVILRCTEKAQSIHHISRILYHWRMHAASTAEDPASKLYCYQAGEKAVSDHLRRVGLKGSARYMEEPLWGTYQVTYDIPDEPSVSVLLINYDDSEIIHEAVRYFDEVNTCRNFEIIVCEAKNTELHVQEPGVRTILVSDDMTTRDFNAVFSQAKGDYVLVLNNVSTEDPEAVRILLGYCMQERTAVTAGKVLSGSGEVVSSYEIVGVGDFCTDAFIGMTGSGAGNLNRNVVACECSAADMNCVMIRKEMLSAVDGLDEQYSLGGSFRDFCLKMRQDNRKIIYLPYSVWQKENAAGHTHKATVAETDALRNKWADVIAAGDPYYNVNYDHEAGPFSIR